MKHVYEGKTKSVFELENANYLLKFKDDATGTNGQFDPGANTVGLQIAGMGNASLRLTRFFFEKIESQGIPTHLVRADLSDNTLEVLPAKSFGKGLEVICRYKATGSFMRRYGMYATEGQDLDAIVEVTLKDDERQDPVISKEALEALHIIDGSTYDTLVEMTKKIGRIVKEALAKKDLELFDIKFEFGLHEGKVILIDEISGGNMRVFHGKDRVDPIALALLLTE